MRCECCGDLANGADADGVQLCARCLPRFEHEEPPCGERETCLGCEEECPFGAVGGITDA